MTAFQREQFDKYELSIGFNNNAEGFKFPVNPEAISVEGGSNGKTYEIVGRVTGEERKSGEVNVIKGPKLRTVSFSGVFPAQNSPYVVASVLFEPMWYVGMIEKWMAARFPVRFIFAGHYKVFKFAQTGKADYTDINIAASIESFTWKESGGTPGDIEYSITLKEYVFYSAQKVKVTVHPVTGQKTVTKAAPKRADERIRPQTYKLQPGDTLIEVAHKVLGDSSRWREIQLLNGLSDADLRKMPVGLVLKIPQGAKPDKPIITPKSKNSSKGGEYWRKAAQSSGGANWHEAGGLKNRAGGFSGPVEMDDEIGSGGGHSGSGGSFGGGGTTSGGYTHSGSSGGW
ncbi:LysM peptidoglycan-binding domain-containing protein [Gorillibacterium sp. sgz500922]|uniref:LysM peptidoglycan-binding domain-containing protein n=1 Tax=Gorillibacterium sp. sgz500922 TaxID=3446694 RepID=UPI003F66146B